MVVPICPLTQVGSPRGDRFSSTKKKVIIIKNKIKKKLQNFENPKKYSESYIFPPQVNG